LRKTLRALVGASIGLSALHANAQESLLVGIATAKCEKMNQLLELDPENSQRLFSGWLDGFLSGFNLAIELEDGKGNAININTPSFPDASVRFQWLKATCREHPEKPLWVHARNLFAILRSGQH
jgi:hypothetical protein